ncbi:hypothetical protein AXW78_21365 [Bacillus thuringiensis]|uniref:Uncharacterized protein n=1 Tax=Bacillus thuringiensis TaxID=1428 RepID=A0A9W3YIC0_BACTU|nr:hypothetical protein AXW78_21365 [Bacillus thuringiensis]AYF82697.1 hypothetical protein D7J84_16770 [Bacillus thuringiensis]PNK38145.1 hypothetical protein CBR55_11220 [Bacillus thuringiensis]
MDLQDTNMDNNTAVECKVLLGSYHHMSSVRYMLLALRHNDCKLHGIPALTFQEQPNNLAYKRYNSKVKMVDDTKTITPYLNFTFLDIICS